MNMQMQIFKHISFEADDKEMEGVEARSQAKEISQFSWVSKILLAKMKEESGVTLDKDELRELSFGGKGLGECHETGYRDSKDLTASLPDNTIGYNNDSKFINLESFMSAEMPRPGFNVKLELYFFFRLRKILYFWKTSELTKESDRILETSLALISKFLKICRRLDSQVGDLESEDLKILRWNKHHIIQLGVKKLVNLKYKSRLFLIEVFFQSDFQVTSELEICFDKFFQEENNCLLQNNVFEFNSAYFLIAFAYKICRMECIPDVDQKILRYVKDSLVPGKQFLESVNLFCSSIENFQEFDFLFLKVGF